MHDIDRTQRELEMEEREHEQEHELEHEHEQEHELEHEHEHELEHEGEAFLGSLFGEAEHEQEHELEQEHEHEFEHEGEAFLGSLFGEAEHEQEHELEAESPLNESQEMELASELLEVSSEAELEQFIGGLFKKAVRGAGRFMRSPQGRMLGGMLKGFAKKALPIAGTALGGMFGGPIGAKLGGGLGRVATNLFELELEGLSHEDREFEVARQFVRMGAAATRSAARSALRAPSVPPRIAARRAFTAAARTYAPGLLRRRGLRPAGITGHRPHRRCRHCAAAAARRRSGGSYSAYRRRSVPVYVTRADGTRVLRRPRRTYAGGPTAYTSPAPYTVDATPTYDAPSYPQPGYEEPNEAVYAGGRRSGRWLRRGNKVVLLGL